MPIYLLKTNDEFNPIDFCRDAKKIQKVLQRAVDDALSMHRRLGNPIAIWEDGKVVIIPADQIVLSSELPTTQE